jgi:hypothetical protein
MLEIYWGGISLHRSKWGLGNTVLKTVATPEQIEKWKKHTIAIAITEPGARVGPGEHSNDRDFRSRNRRMDTQR